jgi:hypothetical protein
VSTKTVEPGAGKKPPRLQPSTATVLAVVNGVLVGVGSVYASTHSVLVTLIAAVAAVLLAAMALARS